jgi:hypothetical protein
MLKAVFRWGARVGLLLWLCFLGLVGARFAEQNPQVLQIHIFQWVLPELSVGVLLCIALLIGVVLGICVFVPSLLISKVKERRLKSKLVKTQVRLDATQKILPGKL